MSIFMTEKKFRLIFRRFCMQRYKADRGDLCAERIID